MIINLIILKTDKNEIVNGLKWFSKAAIYAAGDTWHEPFEIPGIGAIWFLWAMFLGGLIFQILLRLKSVIRALICILLLYAADFSVRHFMFLPFSIQPACSAVIFIYIGYLWHKYEKSISDMNIELKATLLIISLFVWMGFITDFKSFWLVHSDFGRGFVDVVGSICASVIVLVICKLLLEKINGVSRILAYLGEYSIVFLCAHIIEISTFPYNTVITTLFGQGLSEGYILIIKIAMKLIWCILFVFIFTQFNWFRTLMGIKKKN